MQSVKYIYIYINIKDPSPKCFGAVQVCHLQGAQPVRFKNWLPLNSGASIDGITCK